MVLSELHLHLEGTIDRECVRLLDPALTAEQVNAVWGFTDFTGFLDCFKFAVQRLRGPDDYFLVARRMIEELHRQGIGYAEVTLAAGVVLWRGFDFDAVWRAVRAAQQDSPVEIHWNLDAIRQFGPDHVMEVARLASRFVGDGAISFGIGGAELLGPAAGFADAYRYARDSGLRLTAHAGETDGAHSIRAALAIGAERIGHGIRAVEDPDLLRELSDRNIPLEVCITSNVCTGSVASLESHPVRTLFDAGVPITLNTDDPGMFACTLESEFVVAARLFGFTEAELASIKENAWKYRFASDGKH